MSVFAFFCYAVIAAACGFIAERLTPGVVPGGVVTCTLAGIIGAWVGSILFGDFGPDLSGVFLAPCVFGAAVLVFFVSLFSRAFRLTTQDSNSHQ